MTHFVRFMPKSFAVFDAIMNGTVFKILTSSCLLLVCKIKLIFKIWKLNDVTWPSSFTSCRSFFFFFVGSLGFSTWVIMPSVNRGSFISLQFVCLFLLVLASLNWVGFLVHC